MEVLKETDLNFLGPKKAGKVRVIYDRGDKLILITTDKHSSFDRIIAHVPWKGQVLDQVSDWWFDKTSDIRVVRAFGNAGGAGQANGSFGMPSTTPTDMPWRST